MTLKLKPAGKIFIIAAIVAVSILSIKWYQGRPKEVGPSLEVGKVALPDAPEERDSDIAMTGFWDLRNTPETQNPLPLHVYCVTAEAQEQFSLMYRFCLVLKLR